MRVLHLIDSLSQGGAEALVKDIVLRMRERGIDVSVAVLKKLDTPFERELRDKGISFLPTAGGGIHSPIHMLSLMNYLKGFDLVQAHLFPAQLFLPLAAMLGACKAPLVWTEHTTHHRRRKRWLHPLDTWMYGRYTAIACASEAIADSLRAWMPGLKQQITVVPNGIDVKKFRHASPLPRASLGVNNGNCVLLYVASFQARKDHGTLLKAMTQIPNADLLLVGDGKLRGQFERQAKTLGIARRVHFLGHRQDIAELLKTADVYVHAPMVEGFGIAAAEALAAGKPIVASNVPGLAQVVGDAGLLVQAGDHANLATEVCKLIGSQERRAELANMALLRSNQFSIEETVSAYIDLYRSVLSNHA